jgi:hypothetical protein
MRTSNASFSSLNVTLYSSEVIELTDDICKERIIAFCLNSLKSFVGILKTQVLNYKKLVVLALNHNTNNPNQNLVPSSIALTQINFNTLLGNNIIYSSLKSININNVTETFDYLITSRDNINIVTNNQSLNLKTCIYYIKRLFFLLNVYLTTYIIPNFTSNAFNVSQNEKTKKSLEFILNVLDLFYEIRNILYFKISLAISMLTFIYSIKDLIIQCGEEAIIKIIFIILNIGWPNYEQDIQKTFTESFNMKFRKFELERIRISSDKFLKREYVNLIADTNCLYFVEKSTQSKTLFNVFNTIFKGKEMREIVFLDLVKW